MNNLKKIDENMELMAKTSILVVDDTELNYLLICAILRKSNIDVSWASNGFKAIEMIESGHQYDLVLMDYHMPGMNGIETAQQMRMINQDLHFIVQTAAIDEDELQFIHAFCDDVILKPIQSNSLKNKIQKYIINQPMLVS